MFKNRIHRSVPALAAAAALVALLAAPAAQAATPRPQNLTRLISDSQAIVQGVVRSVTDGIDQNGLPYTEVTIHVRASAKGSIADDSDYTFRQFGLTKPMTMANGHRLVAVSPDGFPKWHEGESVVAFLHQPASRTGLQTTAGLAQGKLNFVNDHLFNEFNNSGLFDGVRISDGLLTPEEQNMLTTPRAVDAGTFMNLVHRAVSEQWIENGEMR
ncbi:MAG TPA: hypothetical protein VNI57_12185 [Candidatus Saccharimonadales bacterium]|nr:hypothetical protein [Candidatus Saccharimonadales bacterium]